MAMTATDMLTCQEYGKPIVCGPPELIGFLALVQGCQTMLSELNRFYELGWCKQRGSDMPASVIMATRFSPSAFPPMPAKKRVFDLQALSPSSD
jgi:hypothetical protein